MNFKNTFDVVVTTPDIELTEEAVDHHTIYGSFRTAKAALLDEVDGAIHVLKQERMRIRSIKEKTLPDPEQAEVGIHAPFEGPSGFTAPGQGKTSQAPTDEAMAASE